MVWVDDLGGWIVTDHELCLQTLMDGDSFTVDDERFSTRRVVGPSMLSLDGAEHARHRQAFGPAFRARAVRESLETWTGELVESLVDDIAGRGEADLRATIALPLATAVMRKVLGLDRVSTDELSRWNTSITRAIDEVTAGKRVPDRGVEAFDALRRAVREGMREGSLLAHARASGGLEPDEIAANVAVLLIGGIVTSDGAISILFRHVLDHPSVVRRLIDDPDLIPAAVEESFRLEPAAAFVDRYATRDVDLGDSRVSRGDLVRVSISAANRDPTVFDRPDAFDIDRPNSGDHITFARGSHACLGIHVARLEARMALGVVLERLGEISDARPRGPAPSGLIFRAPTTVPAIWGGGSGAVR